MLNYYLKPDFQDEVWTFNHSTAAIVACGSPQFIIKSHSQHWVPWTHRAAWWAYPVAWGTCVTVATWMCQSSHLWPKKADCANFTESLPLGSSILILKVLPSNLLVIFSIIHSAMIIHLRKWHYTEKQQKCLFQFFIIPTSPNLFQNAWINAEQLSIYSLK